MRFYNPGDEIYMFGFSRGAYIARFLAEMLDHIGLLSHGNEEMVKFAWKAFAQWQCRRGDSKHSTEKSSDTKEQKEIDEKTETMYRFMKGFRETFSRPVGRIRFLGLFDTVNSVPQFENAWMQRSKFPYTARSSAKVIRHAVSIDERRAKFRQDLLYQQRPHDEHHHHHHHHQHGEHPHIDQFLSTFRQSIEFGNHPEPNGQQSQTNGRDKEMDIAPEIVQPPEKEKGNFLSPYDDVLAQDTRGRRPSLARGSYAPYRPRSRSRQSSIRNCDGASLSTSGLDYYEDESDQDIDEVWFAGGHGDIGGGWDVTEDEKSASHVPLAWIVREATKAGLNFDMEKVREMGCAEASMRRRATFANNGLPKAQLQEQALHRPSIQVQDSNSSVPHALPMSPTSNSMEDNEAEEEGPRSPFHELMHRAHTSRLHDSLKFGDGLGNIAVAAWTFMEWLPFRRMDLQKDGSWKPIRWPLPRGEVRDIPASVRVHGSVIRRLKLDENYRPGNLIIGGGGRGVKKAPEKYGIGQWHCVAEPGDPIGEIWARKVSVDNERQKEE